MAQSDRPQEAVHGAQHSRHLSAQLPASAQESTPVPAPQAVVGNGPLSVPTEDQVRAARDLLARANAAGVKHAGKGGPAAGGQPRSMLQLPDGTIKPRIQYIREQWALGVGRGVIQKAIRACPGQEGCSYQIIFSATRGIEGGPEMLAKAAALVAAAEKKTSETVAAFTAE
jgi:hypothetical protein